MVKISIATVRSLINHLSYPVDNNSTKVNISRDRLLKHIGLTESQLNQEQQLINSVTYDALFSFAQGLLENNQIGFEFGKTISPDRWGILGYIAFTAPTLKIALAKQKNIKL